MKPRNRLLPVLVFLLALPAFAADALDPAAAVRALRAERAERTKFTKGGPTPDYPGIDTDIAAKAAAKLAVFDPAKVDLAQARDWAALYTLAENHAASRDILRRYLAQPNLPAELRHSAQFDLAMSGVKLNDGHIVYEMLQAMTITPENAVTLGSYFGGTFHHYVFNAKGAKAAIELIDRIEPVIPAGPFASDEVRKSTGWSRRQLAAARALYLSELGKSKEAIAVIDRALATLDEDIFRKRDLVGDRKRYEVAESPAPALPAERVHGQFTNLEAYRGKVVLVEFTAHWCHACHAALPALVQLNAELKSKGFEIVSVTKFYGHFRSLGLPEKKMSKDEEFAKMPAMMKEQGVTWPMVYTDDRTFGAYGVNGIPQLTLVDKQGRIRKIDRGFSVAKMDRLRDTILTLLAE